jgi:hypothetical protein
MNSDSARGIDRRRLIRWGGAAAAGAVPVGVPLAATGIGHAGSRAHASLAVVSLGAQAPRRPLNEWQ